MPPNFKQFRAARKYGYRSGLEHKIAEALKELKVDYGYECVKIEWEDLAYRTYTPDFVLSNGIIIETKGMFTAADRRKHLAVKKQHPALDIRFLMVHLLAPFHFSAAKLDKLRMLILTLFFQPFLRNDTVVISKPKLDTPLCIRRLCSLT